jgi:hypothetical protein
MLTRRTLLAALTALMTCRKLPAKQPRYGWKNHTFTYVHNAPPVSEADRQRIMRMMLPKIVVEQPKED